MTDQSTVFNKENESPSNPPATPSNPNDVFANQLASIKNEDGQQKYGTVEKALEGTAHAQELIPQLKSKNSTLEAENLALKEKLGTMASVEDVVSRLTAQNLQPQTPSQPASVDGLTEEAVIGLVNKVTQESKLVETAQANEQKVQDAMVSKFGDKAGDVVAQKAEELNTTPAALQELARQNPTMVLSLFGNVPSSPSASSTPSSINIPSGAPTPEKIATPALDLLKGNRANLDEFNKAKQSVYAKYDIKVN